MRNFKRLCLTPSAQCHFRTWGNRITQKLIFLVWLILSAPFFINQSAASVITQPSIPSGPCGGDLGGTYPNCTVLSVADVTTGILSGANGGSGVANTGKTITLGGNLNLTGAFNTTLAAVDSLTKTLPLGTTTLVGGGQTCITTGAIMFVGSAGICNQNGNLTYNNSNVAQLALLGSTNATLVLQTGSQPWNVQSDASSNFVLQHAGDNLITWKMFQNGDFLVGGTTDGNYRLDVQKSGSTGTVRFFDQTASTGATRVQINKGAADSTSTNTLVSDASASFGGKLNVYQNLATVGVGVTPIYGAVHSTAQVASIGTATLCAAAVCTGGLYVVHAALLSTVTCAVPGPGAIAATLTWTDEAGTKTAQTIPLNDNNALTLSSSLALGTTTGYAFGDVVIRSTGANPIQYATTYTACTTGTGTYNIDLTVEQKQ